MSGLPKPRSITSSPARRSSSFSRSISAKAYGGRREIRRSSTTRNFTQASRFIFDRNAPVPDWELVLKRNPVERLKQEKSPLGILGELPALVAAGYERIAEEDIVRLKWWGAYHDKPKVGTFMLRIKLPAGRVTSEQLRT